MQKTVKILAVLLAAQLLLAAGIGFTDGGVSAESEALPLVNFAHEKVDRITLEGPADAKVILAKKNGVWELPDLGDFPAGGSRVQQLIEQLVALRSGVPVATSRGARERFKVSDDDFERRVTLFRGDETLGRIYLGTSPAMRLMHARGDGSDAIFAVKMAAYDVPVKAADWEDKSVLTLPKSNIVSISLHGLGIVRGGTAAQPDEADDKPALLPAWKADGLGEGMALKPEAVDKLADLLADLRFEMVLGREAKEEYALENPVLECSLTLKGGETLTYRLGKTEGKEDYTLKVSNRPEYFRLAAYKAKPLIEAAAVDGITESISEDDDGNEQAAQTGEP